MLETDQVVASGSLGYPADRTSTDLQHDPAGGLSVLHVVVKAGPTNSQFNEHCLPVMGERRVTVCSLFPADVQPPPEIALVQGDGSVRGCFRSLRVALARSTYDAVHVHAAGAGVLALAVYLTSRRSRRDLVFTLHTSWPNVRPRNRLFLFVVAGLFPVFVACGQASADSLPRSLKRLVRRLEVIPNGVDVERIDSVLEGATVPAPPSGRAGQVVSVGRLIGIKDPATVVAAFRRAARPGDQLVMVGDGELRQSLELDVRMFPGEGVVFFTGLVPRDEVHETLHCADVFVSASTVEGLPVAVLEAMVCRCLVVLSDIPAHREIASRTSSVQLVAPGDVAGFGRAIGRICAMSPAARLRAGEELRSCAVEHYSVHRMNQAYGQVYASLARKRTARVRARPAVARSTARRVAYAGACALLGAGAALSYARFHPPVFEADVTLAVADSSEALSDDTVEDATGSAADLAGLVDRRPVLEPVAQRLGVASWRSLRGDVGGSLGTEDPLLVVVTASAETADGAERLAAAVANQLRALTGEAAVVGFDPGFAEHELESMPLEIAAIEDRLEEVSSADDAALGAEGTGDEVSERRVADLRATLSGLHAAYQGMLDWRVQTGDRHGLTVADRTAGRAAPPVPDPPVLAAAGAAAGACLWLAGWLLLRRETSGDRQ